MAAEQRNMEAALQALQALVQDGGFAPSFRAVLASAGLPEPNFYHVFHILRESKLIEELPRDAARRRLAEWGMEDVEVGSHPVFATGVGVAVACAGEPETIEARWRRCNT